MPQGSKFPEEFRRDAVALVVASPHRTLRDIAHELGIGHERLRLWVKAAREVPADDGAARDGGLSGDERAELRRLRHRVADLEMEKEILRTAAYFAQEMGR